MAAHRYWRALCHTPITDVYAFAEIKGYTSYGGVTNVLTGGAASASTTQSTNAASRAFDNNPSTFWASNVGTDGQWVAYDLGAGNDKDIIEVTFTARNDAWSYQTPHNVDWQYSDDAITWTTYFSIATAVNYTQGSSQTFNNRIAPANVPQASQIAMLGIEEETPAPPQISQFVMLSILNAPSNTYSLGPAFKLPCWQPCTAFGTEAIVIRLN